MINEPNLFDQPVKNDLRTYDTIWKIMKGQGYDYTTACLLDYPYFKENCKISKLTAIDLTKQKELDADPKAIQQINFTGNLARNSIANRTRNCENIVISCCFNIISI